MATTYETHRAWAAAPTTPTTTTPSAPYNPTNRDAAARLTQILTEVGLESLAGKVMAYLTDGMGEDSIMLELQGTQEWKTRFKANDARRLAGLPILSPAEYLATERSYRQIMMESGVPVGFYDTTSDFEQFLANDMSPSELQDRVKAATAFVQKITPEQRALFGQWYTEGDMIAFALDQDRAAPLVGKAFQAAAIGGIGAQSGLNIGQATAEQLAAAGVTDQQAQQGLVQARRDKDVLSGLASIDQVQGLSDDQLARDALVGDALVREQKDQLASRERARLSGRSGVANDSLGSKSTGL